LNGENSYNYALLRGGKSMIKLDADTFRYFNGFEPFSHAFQLLDFYLLGVAASI